MKSVDDRTHTIPVSHLLSVASQHPSIKVSVTTAKTQPPKKNPSRPRPRCVGILGHGNKIDFAVQESARSSDLCPPMFSLTENHFYLNRAFNRKKSKNIETRANTHSLSKYFNNDSCKCWIPMKHYLACARCSFACLCSQICGD